MIVGSESLQANARSKSSVLHLEPVLTSALMRQHGPVITGVITMIAWLEVVRAARNVD